jgi:O-acetyl-ADP-ribose deacetylase (regulator of RNase III)
MACAKSFTKANELKMESIALPAISSGIYGFPKPLCA